MFRAITPDSVFRNTFAVVTSAFNKKKKTRCIKMKLIASYNVCVNSYIT